MMAVSFQALAWPVGMGDGNDQVREGHLVNALAHTGDEGRDTLR